MGITLIGTLEFAKVLMTVFVMLYCYFFLRRIKKKKAARPWQYLFIASMCLFLVQLSGVFLLFEEGTPADQFLVDLHGFLEFAFISLLLFSFIYQHYILREEGMLSIKHQQPSDVFEDIKQKYLELERKLAGSSEEDEIDPEEELEKEMSSVEDKEIKKEEKEIEEVVKDND